MFVGSESPALVAEIGISEQILNLITDLDFITKRVITFIPSEQGTCQKCSSSYRQKKEKKKKENNFHLTLVRCDKAYFNPSQTVTFVLSHSYPFSF